MHLIFLDGRYVKLNHILVGILESDSNKINQKFHHYIFFLESIFAFLATCEIFLSRLLVLVFITSGVASF